MTYECLNEIAAQAGFSASAPLDAATIELRSDVREMCAANTCGMYAKRWSCPPGCGTLAECEDRVKGFSRGILVQTVGTIEDSFDFESMTEIEQAHKCNFAAMNRALITEGCSVLAIGSGCCTECTKCTYPDAPCRFPDRMVTSMEAYGIVVSDICAANNLPYYYGPGKIAFTGCFLVNE